MSVDRLVAQLGARQYGLITIRQLAQAGMTRGMRRRRVEDGRLQLFRHGVYAIAGAPPGWRQTVLGAVLAAGRDAVASHVTAGLLWDLKHCDRTRAASIHVTAPRAVRLEGVTGHVRHLNAGECQTRFSIPVTSPQQTILDLAATLTADQLGQCVDDALRRDLIRLERLRLAVGACGRGRRPVRSLRSVLAERGPGYHPGANDWEKDMDRSWEAWGLPLAIRQYRVVANNKRYRLDRASPTSRSPSSGTASRPTGPGAASITTATSGPTSPPPVGTCSTSRPDRARAGSAAPCGPPSPKGKSTDPQRFLRAPTPHRTTTAKKTNAGATVASAARISSV